MGLSIGFVPTMGALHPGHIALIKESLSRCDITICSIFVNPTQFNDRSDYNKYPNRLENDIRLLEAAGTNLLFLPDVNDVYNNGLENLEQYDIGYLETILEGKFRPGHFQGVAQVMMRLLKAVNPDYLFMGQKDYQQCMVINRLLDLLKFKATLVTCPTLRENDGLAMSSRNLRLTPDQRAKASSIYSALTFVKKNLASGHLGSLKKQAVEMLEKEGFIIDYFEIAKAADLELTSDWDGTTPLVALVAAFAGDVRLIDNMLLNS
jgi:pantoate--beta-alanine ligase